MASGGSVQDGKRDGVRGAAISAGSFVHINHLRLHIRHQCPVWAGHHLQVSAVRIVLDAGHAAGSQELIAAELWASEPAQEDAGAMGAPRAVGPAAQEWGQWP